MFDFNFSIPTEIYFGKDCWRQAGSLMKKYAERILMVYGSDRIFCDGPGEDIVGSLKEAGCTVVQMGGVKPNADAEYIRKAIETVRREHIDGILAVGGGSVIDSAKAVSVGSGFDGDIMELYERIPSEEDDRLECLPVGAVVTIPASASESNEMSVISDEKTGRKIAHPFGNTRPVFALLDPALTVSIGSRQTACSGFDIFSHAFERYFDLRRGSSLLDRMTVSLMQEVIDVLPQVIINPDDESLRGELMVAATVAHNDMLGPGGDFACHEMSHLITEKTGIPHGGALAMIIPAWCEYVSAEHPERFAQFFEQVFDIREESTAQTVSTGIGALRGFIQEIGLPQTMTVEREKAESLHSLAVETLAGRPSIGGGMVCMYADDIEEVYRRFIVVA